jgi:hypothetical protein
MNISRAEQSNIRYSQEQYRLQQTQAENLQTKYHQKIVEQRSYERIIAERVSRNLRLDLDKGRNVDIEC